MQLRATSLAHGCVCLRPQPVSGQRCPLQGTLGVAVPPECLGSCDARHPQAPSGVLCGGWGGLVGWPGAAFDLRWANFSSSRGPSCSLVLLCCGLPEGFAPCVGQGELPFVEASAAKRLSAQEVLGWFAARDLHGCCPWAWLPLALSLNVQPVCSSGQFLGLSKEELPLQSCKGALFQDGRPMACLQEGDLVWSSVL